MAKVRESSGNVFADLGFADADMRLAKVRLAGLICDLIAKTGMVEKEVAVKLGIEGAKAASLMRGKLCGFSIARLMRFVTALDHDVIITIREPQDTAHASVRVLVGI